MPPARGVSVLQQETGQRQGNGVYVSTLTLGSAAGQLSVMPRVNGQNAVAQPLVLNVAGDASKAEIRDMTVKVNNQLANGQSANQITLTVVDSYGNPLQGQEVTLTLPQGVTSKTGNTVTTNAAGKADIELDVNGCRGTRTSRPR